MQKEHEFDKTCAPFPMIGGTNIHNPEKLNSDAHIHDFQENHLKTFRALRCGDFLQTNLLLDDTVTENLEGKQSSLALRCGEFLQTKLLLDDIVKEKPEGKESSLACIGDLQGNLFCNSVKYGF